MNNTPSLNEINKTAKMNPNLLTRHYKVKLMNDFMYTKYQNPKMKQSQIADQFSLSSSTIQRYKNDINMLSPYRIDAKKHQKTIKNVKNTDFDNNSQHEADLKRPQMTSIDLKRPQSASNENSKKTNTKSNLKGGLVHDHIEINEHYLDKILKNNNT